MLKYHKMKGWLHDNMLTENPNDFILKIHSEASLSVNDISQSAVLRGGADISAPAMTHAVNLWLKEMGYQLCDGFSVNTGWFNVSAKVKGVFDSSNEKFNPTKHTILFDFHQGVLLRKELNGAEVEVLGVADTFVSVASVTDIKTCSVNDLLTPNKNLRISGSKLKIMGNNPLNGVYFVSLDTKKTTKVDASEFVINNPSELIIVIPNLAIGTYKLVVTTQFSGNTKIFLKEPRSVEFDKVLSVV